MSFIPVPPFGTGNIPLTSVVIDTRLDETSPSAALCKTPAVVNFFRYSELNGLPIVTFPFEDPVLILVTLSELLFRLIAPPDTVVAPVMVAPDCPVSKPAEVIVPVVVVEISPVVVTSSPALDGVKILTDHCGSSILLSLNSVASMSEPC
ncbi:MAG: hypothetical protein IPH69_03745 [Bacteroidales bacterium]|nr:hypothetical protein [Bacteroidales bacterium]